MVDVDVRTSSHLKEELACSSIEYSIFTKNCVCLL